MTRTEIEAEIKNIKDVLAKMSTKKVTKHGYETKKALCEKWHRLENELKTVTD